MHLTQEERSKILSNDYADLIIEYNTNKNLLERYKNDTTNFINYRYAVVHTPLPRGSRYSISDHGYNVIPGCYGLLSEQSLESTGIIRLRSIPKFDLRGQGVLLGIIDTGIDYTNQIFQYADKTTRIVALWDQTIESENQFPEETNYGTEYTREQINDALLKEDPYQYVPSRDENGHGTMLAAIAGGKEVPEEGFYGIATDAEYVVVKLKEAKAYLREFYVIPEEANCYQSNDIMFGVKYVSEIAEKLGRPIVICIALGDSLGSHTETDPLSTYLYEISIIAGTAVVVAAGNEGNGRRHYYGVVDTDIGYNTVELNVAENDLGFTMALWGVVPSIYSIDILSPTGEYVPRIPARMNENQEISFVFESAVINIDYQMIQTRSGNQLILFRLRNPTPGIWKFQVYLVGNLSKGFHIWLPMEHFILPDTYFINSNPDTTVLTPGNTYELIVITAYNPENDSIYINASRGFTRNNRTVPKLAAPGVNIISPIGTGYGAVNGTGAAAAHTAGAAAMLLEWAVVKGNYPEISTMAVKNSMIRGARRDSGLKYPDKVWGWGILNIYNTFDSLRRTGA